MSHTLQFSQPSAMRHAFAVMADDKQIGTLTYAKLRRRIAQAELAGYSWHFLQKGIITTTVQVRDAHGAVVAEYRKPFFKTRGTLTYQDTTYYFASKRLQLRARSLWTDVQGNEIMTYQVGGFIKYGGHIDIADDALPPVVRSLLICLGLYIALNASEDEASVAATA